MPVHLFVESSVQAITLEADQLCFRHDYPDPEHRPGEVLVRPLMTGICETDLQLAQGYMGFQGVLGHEFVGEALEGPYQGQRVVGEINCSCHQCETCVAGRTTHCPHRTVIGIDRHDGAMAGQLSVPHSNLHLVSDSLTNEQAVLVEPLAAAFQITQQVEISERDNVAIVGDGRLGLFSAMVLAMKTSHVTVFGKHEAKLERFRRRGIQHTHSILCDGFEAPRKCFDLVVDCTGSSSGLQFACEIVRPRGTVVLKTTIAKPHQLSLAPLVIDEINLVGSRCGPFATALEAIATEQIDVSGLVSDVFRFSDVEQAFQRAQDPSSFKVVFDNS